MAKPLLRIKARKMRSRGNSVKDIAEKLKVSKSTASLWSRDIILSEKQLEKLKNRALQGAELGRIRGALIQKHRRLELINKMNQEGSRRLKTISKNEFFLAGLALYWAEGSKKTKGIQICNSDPEMIKFIILWLNKFFDVKKEDLTLHVGINISHKTREKIVREYWSKVTNIHLSQFRKTSFKKVKNKKIYKNHNRHFGTLTMNVLKPSRIYYRMMGLIEGLKKARVAQW